MWSCQYLCSMHTWMSNKTRNLNLLWICVGDGDGVWIFKICSECCCVTQHSFGAYSCANHYFAKSLNFVMIFYCANFLLFFFLLVEARGLTKASQQLSTKFHFSSEIYLLFRWFSAPESYLAHLGFVSEVLAVCSNAHYVQISLSQKIYVPLSKTHESVWHGILLRNLM